MTDTIAVWEMAMGVVAMWETVDFQESCPR
jgi:hypothetical protein